MIIKFVNNALKELKALKKKYISIEQDIEKFLMEIEKGNVGDRIQNKLNLNIYKTRLKNSSSNTGKSRGFRVITYLKTKDYCYILSIYSKTERSNIQENEIIKIIKQEIGLDE